MLEVAGPTESFFGHSGYMYWDQGFNKGIGECTIRQTDRKKLWLYLAAF